MNEELNEMQGNNGGTATPDAPVDSAEELNNQQQTSGVNTPTPQEETPIKAFSQEQVNDFVRERLNRVYGRYGCKNRQELDDLIGKSQSYDVMKDRYVATQEENAKLSEELTFLKNNVNPERYDDVRAFFKGKGLEFGNDALVEALTTHPEWLNQPKVEAPTTTIQYMGTEPTIKNKPSERSIASKMFGVEL